MEWQLMLVLLVIVNTASIIFNKIASDKLPKKKSVGIFYQYIFCALLGFLYAFLAQEIIFSPILIFVGLVGLLNAFGSYCQWQAVGLSLSKTTLFFPLMEITTIFLALIFIGEFILWTPQLIFGVLFCFLAMYLFRIPMKSRDKEQTRNPLKGKWFLYVVLMILIIGIAGFLLKFFSFTVARGAFIMSWYSGAFLGSLLILFLEKANPLKISKKTVFAIFPASLTIWGSLLALYWTYQLGGPVSFVLPVRGLAITLIPAFIGWQKFKEGKSFTKREIFGFIIGTTGAVMVLLR
jgi:hypothetical protein